MGGKRGQKQRKTDGVQLGSSLAPNRIPWLHGEEGRRRGGGGKERGREREREGKRERR